MRIQIVDPTDIPDWDSFLLRTGEADFFHSSSWARTLKESYGYRPYYFTSTENGRLALSVPLMEVTSVWTGKRGVSLPFSDHCHPFFLDRQVLREAIDMTIDHGEKAGWRYIDWRAQEFFEDDPPSWDRFYAHDIDLSHDEKAIFERLLPSNRRNIRKAIGAGVSITIGASRDDVTEFCRLNGLTRKRHGLPPQPTGFFEKVYEHILSTGHGLIISARNRRRVIASLIYFHFGRRAMFKYGASEMGALHLRPNNLIMWEAIKYYRDRGFETLGLGRTELDNPGLLRYKRAWSAEERLQRYYRYDIRRGVFLTRGTRSTVYRKVFSKIPVGILRIMGRLAYRHMG